MFFLDYIFKKYKPQLSVQFNERSKQIKLGEKNILRKIKQLLQKLVHLIFIFFKKKSFREQ